MESRTYIKNIRISAKKLRFLADDIKKRTPAEALHYLNYTTLRGAKIFHKTIRSAIANAKLKLKTGDDLLRFKSLVVEQGQKLKRFRAGGRGTAKPFERKSAHIKIVLVVEKLAEKPAEKVAAKVTPEVETESKQQVKKVKTADK